MKKIAVIGGGVSGLSVANLLKDRYDVTVFEKESMPGGLVRCKSVNGSLFHMCGGHVFNSKRTDVLNWFWGFFKQESEFVKVNRNSVVCFNDDKIVPYPIENHIYYFDQDVQQKIVEDWLSINNNNIQKCDNFADFLRTKFGEELYRIYFQPYNEKVWKCKLVDVPINWLDGKLPMPTVQEMFFNNINHVEERTFVHSTFWYERQSGSQFLADRLSEGLNIQYNSLIDSITYQDTKWLIDGVLYDKVVFCGNIKELPPSIYGLSLESYMSYVDDLKYHGTTAVFCEIDKNPYSWIYQPNNNHTSHRIICTGNFSKSNNSISLPEDRITATIEFTDEISKADILENLIKMPFHPVYLDHMYNKYTYPIQDKETRSKIKELKSYLSQYSFYMTGRFADWEYYNMDAAMGAAMDLCATI